MRWEKRLEICRIRRWGLGANGRERTLRWRRGLNPSSVGVELLSRASPPRAHRRQRPFHRPRHHRATPPSASADGDPVRGDWGMKCNGRTYGGTLDVTVRSAGCCSRALCTPNRTMLLRKDRLGERERVYCGRAWWVCGRRRLSGSKTESDVCRVRSCGV